MSPVAVNGRTLGVAENGIFTAANTDLIHGGALWNGSGSWAPPKDLGAAISWTDMRAYIAERTGVFIEPAGSNSTARTRPAQQFFWDNQPPPAAPHPPFFYSSNHGWGIAVDVMTRQMAFLIRQVCAKFGWSFDEGDRVGEWWHVRYIGGYTKRIGADPLTKAERKLLAEWDSNPASREHVLDRVAHQIREIRRVARAEKGGWGKRKRAARYRKLTSWFNEKALPSYLADSDAKLISSYYGVSPGAKRFALGKLQAQAHEIQKRARAEKDWTEAHRDVRYQFIRKFVAERTPK